MDLISCWPRRFTPGESDPGSLAGSWVSWKGLLVSRRVNDQRVDQRLLKKAQKPWALLRSHWEMPCKSVLGRMEEKKELEENEQERIEKRQKVISGMWSKSKDVKLECCLNSEAVVSFTVYFKESYQIFCFSIGSANCRCWTWEILARTSGTCGLETSTMWPQVHWWHQWLRTCQGQSTIWLPWRCT